MKKILFMIACCLMATAQNVFADDYGKIFLQHNGNITGVFELMQVMARLFHL